MTEPDDRPSPDEVKGMEVHVAHEMARLLRIGETLRRWRWVLRLWPLDTVARALRVAYAGHGRTVLEFFHDGRLDSKKQRKRRVRRPDGDIDVQLYDYTGAPAGAGHPWTPDHEQRLADADKLLAHLSTGRLTPDRQRLPEWGDSLDRTMFREIIEQMMADVPNAATRFQETQRALDDTRREEP